MVLSFNFLLKQSNEAFDDLVISPKTKTAEQREWMERREESRLY